ncbi:chitodextrinase [Gilvimarinus agarilyticus]|nr:chitodextrinase [Gilvimarinus agarilyticus]
MTNALMTWENNNMTISIRGKLLTALSLTVGTGAAMQAQAYDCASLSDYANTTYAAGDLVRHNGEAFRCEVGGWCSTGGAYEPGVGWAYANAWTGLGQCDGSSQSSLSSSSASSMSSVSSTSSSIASSASSSTGSSCANAWDASVAYTGGAQVTAGGFRFEAKWWTRGDNPQNAGDYGPWELMGSASCGGDPSSSSSSSSVSSVSSSSSSSVISSSSSSVSSVSSSSSSSVISSSSSSVSSVSSSSSSSAISSSSSSSGSVDVGELCEDYPVYPNWPQANYAQKDQVVVYGNIAYSAKYYTDTIPGSDDTWEHVVNCDGTAEGGPALLSMPNPTDPVSLKVAGWPNQVVAATPSTTPEIVDITASIASVTSTAILTNAFEAAITIAQNAGSKTVVIGGDLLGSIVADKGASLGTVNVQAALSATTASIDASDLSNDAKGVVQAYNLILNEMAPNAVFGWELTIGSFANDYHSGYRSVWDAASKAAADALYSFELYRGDNAADIVAFVKTTETAALTSDQWDNGLRFVKQVSDFIESPALLSVPTAQAGSYFLGTTSAERKLRHAAHHNVFAVLFDADSTSLSDKIADYATATVPLYYEGQGSAVDDNLELTSNASLNSTLLSVEQTMNTEAFLYEVSQGSYAPSTVYKWNDYLKALSSMHNVGIAGKKLWLLDEKADDATNTKYAKVAIAAFLSQSMKETIRYNACDENNWSIGTGDPVDYPLSSSCGQLQQDYASYGVNPSTGEDHPYSCPLAPKMEVTATTHAGWYGAPAPLFAAPDAVLEEAGLLVNGAVGYWNFGGGWCAETPERIDTSKQAWERDECKVYVGQKAGEFVHNGAAGKSVEGCGWWGRGVIQTTGRQNFGTLNHFLGRSHVDPATVGTVQEGINVAPAPADPLYANLDFCSNPQLICTSQEHKELKWIAGLFYWVNDVQGYNVDGGPYGDWDYLTELKAYVDGGMQGTEFIDDISGIVNRGCPDSSCPISGEVDGIEDRRENFFLVLEKLGLNPQ